MSDQEKKNQNENEQGSSNREDVNLEPGSSQNLASDTEKISPEASPTKRARRSSPEQHIVSDELVETLEHEKESSKTSPLVLRDRDGSFFTQKETNQTSLVYGTIETTGGGDCLLHAVLGTIRRKKTVSYETHVENVYICCANVEVIQNVRNDFVLFMKQFFNDNEVVGKKMPSYMRKILQSFFTEICASNTTTHLQYMIKIMNESY